MSISGKNKISNGVKIVNVIPITKKVFQENLSYFTSKNIQPGALVTVPVRGKNTLALVSSAEESKNIKALIKTAGFKLKPIKSIKSPSFLRPEFIEACKKTAEYFVSPLGAVIRDFIPQAIVESGANFNYKEHFAAPLKTTYENILVQAQPKDRLQYYKSVIREEFAKNHSVFFCLPTCADIDEFSGKLQKGIEKYALILHNKIPRKKLGEAWNKALSEKHPVLIIATKSFLSLPRKDIATLIVERESSPYYKIKKRPYADARKFAELLSEEMKIKLIAGDSVGRTESFFRGELSAKEIPPSRVLSEAEQIIVNMKKEQGFQVLSAQLKKILEQARANNEKVILFANRRGHSPLTFCNDCARPILCDKCDTPLVLHKAHAKNKKTRFICHKCLTESEAPEKCPYCQSWNLKTLGIGIQKIADEIEKYFPKFKIFRMDSDTIKTQKQGKDISSAFAATPGSLLLGTEILFSYPPAPPEAGQAERVAIISVDSMFTLPDFRINEKIFRLLLKLRGLAKKTFLVQTRLRQARPEEHDIFNNVTRGNISGFYKTEIENRKIFQYPPFKTLIKITREGKNEAQIKKDVQEMEKILEEWKPFSYSAFTPKIKNMYSRHILLKIEPGTWPSEQKKLHQILSSLSPSWKIDVDPESLL